MELLFIGIVAGFLAGVVFAGRHHSRREELFMTRRPYRLDMARHLYGEDMAIRQLVECDNAHLPGDCPLCGAES